MGIYLKIYDIINDKTFKKYFKSEFERDKFARKLQYSKKLMVIEKNEEFYD